MKRPTNRKGATNIVLFVLFVLFGSVVPASAQEGNMVTENWDVGAIMGMMGLAWWRLHKAFDAKIESIRTALDGKIDTKVDAATAILKQDSVVAHGRIEGNIKDSENRVTTSVKTDVDRIYNQINESEKRLTTSVSTDVNRIYDQINALISKGP